LFSGSTQCAVHKSTHLYIGILTIADPTMMVAINDGISLEHLQPLQSSKDQNQTKNESKCKAPEIKIDGNPMVLCST